MTNDHPWRLADLSFAPSGNGRARATINGVEVVRENGRSIPSTRQPYVCARYLAGPPCDSQHRERGCPP